MHKINKFNISIDTIHEEGCRLLWKNVYDSINSQYSNYMYGDIRYIVKRLYDKYDFTQEYLIKEIVYRIIVSESCDEFDDFIQIIWNTLTQLLYDKNYYKFMTHDVFYSPGNNNNNIDISNDF
jgi:hypothetical protein